MSQILIVDDSATMRRMLRAALRELPNASFTEAATGLEAIERLALGPVSVMILDLNMPDMHGIEVLRFLRGQQAYRDIPVVILTTRDDEASRATAIEAGATLFLTKPFAPQTLAGQVSELLAIK